jgi:pyrroloquinoline quinone biosynthesis protein E
MDSGIYLHKPGTLSPRGILDVGLKCVHSCRFCYYSFWDKSPDQFRALRQARFRTGADCREILSGLAAQGLSFYDVTGGEPTLHPEIVDIVRFGTGLGLKSRLITLGQFLQGPDGLLERLLDAGLTDFLFSMHSVEERSFKEFTGGSWERLGRVMQALDKRGFAYGANTVIFDGNYERLEDIAREAAARGVYVHNFIIFNAYHEWNSVHRVAGVQARFTDVAPRLERAVAILEGAGIAVNIRYVPLCVFPGLARHVVGVLGLPYDPFEWRNRACNYDREPSFCSEILPIPESGVRERFAFAPLGERLACGTELMGMRGERFTVFPAKCASCAARPACDGVDPKYLERNGDGELAPFARADLDGPLLRERLEYAAAHRVKASAGVGVPQLRHIDNVPEDR